jgi:phosphatidylinositol-4,5-bisphosphate 3-kinase
VSTKQVAEMVARLKREQGMDDVAAKKEYLSKLRELNENFFEPMGKFQMPLFPSLEVTTLIVEKCRYMSSKMVPLWLVFRNADKSATDPVYVMFKSGDDLRQDILTLQLLRAMDKIWLSDGLDMRLKPYGCIATGVNDHGDGVGMIEIVTQSNTTSGIQYEYGGGAVGALKKNPIQLYIEKHNTVRSATAGA